MINPASTWGEALPLLTSVFQAHCDERHLPGCTFGVVNGGELVLAGSCGVINPGQVTAPDESTVYRIASMTKCFTALAILMLRDEGKLLLDAPAADYAPDLRHLAAPTRDSEAISVRHLLTMSAGWPEDNPWGDRQLWRSDAELAELLQPGISFANAPGVTFEYSNLGYMVLGRIIAQVSGESSLSLITRRILQPLGMRDTVWQREDVDPSRLALGYQWLDGAWVEEPILPSGGDVAAFGGLYSTVADLARWVAFLLSAWPPRDDADDGIVRRATLREMQQPWRLYPPANDAPALGRPVTWTAGGYGFGLSINYEGNLYIVSHAWGLPGYGSHMGWSPDHDLGVIGLGNVRYATMRAAATEALRQLVRQGRVPPRSVQPAPALTAAAEEVNGLLQSWDDERADRLFADNFFLDDSRSFWQAQIAGLAATHGVLRPTPIQPENALRGEWTLHGERGWVRAYLTLTPTISPRVQELGLESVLLPGPALQEALEQLLKLINRPARRAVQKLFVSQPQLAADQPTFYDRMHMVSALCGPCTLGEILAGDGANHVRLHLEGQRAGVMADLRFDEGRRKFVAAQFCQVR